jgi:hypothetical protein
MRPAGPSIRQEGTGKFEFLFVVALIGILGGALMARLIGIERESERTEVDLTVRNMRVGLSLAVGERMMRGRDDSLPELLAANPVSFLGWEPRGYENENGDGAVPGEWYFDPKTRTLAYYPRQPEAFDGRQRLRWKLAAQGSLKGRIVGMRLESLPD